MEENKNAQNSGIITKIKGKLGITNKNIPFTAEYAWIETTYGRGSYNPIEERITHKQKKIRERIEEHFRCSSSETNIVAHLIIVSFQLNPILRSILMKSLNHLLQMALTS